MEVPDTACFAARGLGLPVRLQRIASRLHQSFEPANFHVRGIASFLVIVLQ